MKTKRVRPSRSTVRHAVPLILNARLFTMDLMTSIVRTDGIYVDLEDLLNCIFAPEQAKRLMSMWRGKTTGSELKHLIFKKGGKFSNQATPVDISLVKWLRPSEENTVRNGRGRIACTPMGICTVLNLVRSTRRIPTLESTLDYFERLVLDGANVHVVSSANSRDSDLDSSMRSLLSIPPKPLIDWDQSQQKHPTVFRRDCGK